MRDFLQNEIIEKDMEYIYESNLPLDKLRSRSVLITGSYGMLASYLGYFLCYLNEKYNFNISIYAQGRNPEKMNARYGDYVYKPYFHACYFNITKPIDEDI